MDNDTADRVLLEVKTARSGEETAESMVQFLSSFLNLKKKILPLWWRGLPVGLEIGVFDQGIHFFLSVPRAYKSFFESQLVAQYPKALLTVSKDYLIYLNDTKDNIQLGQLKLSHGPVYPIRTYKEFKEVDPLSSLLGILSKAQPGDVVAIQILLVPISSSWQAKGRSLADTRGKDASGQEIANPYAHVIHEKIASHGFKTAIRLAVSASNSLRAGQFLSEIANSFASFNNPAGNSLLFKKPYLWQKERLLKAIETRSRYFMPTGQVLNVHELATIYHFPTAALSTIHNLSWHKTILSDAPESLPVAEGLSDEQKKDINFIARTEFKNKMTTFGIKRSDRRRHVYIIGKTGSGKSTLIANMAISDMRNREGFAVIDPHGDLTEILLDYVPSYRINDVVYLDPSDSEYSFGLNPLEVDQPYQKELVVSGIVGIFKKIYGTSWGPRLEYILRNTILSVIDLPEATLLMVPDMLTNDSFREKAIKQIKDPVLVNFWVNEFAQMPPKLKAESISPILNKVGQFISSQVIRNIVSHPKSTIDLQQVMDEGKILLLNLSQGKLGEDNAALLGAMIITKLQLAAMNRVNQTEVERRDFYLYVDEFQNFATSSFIKILSEARKYRLNLILANQYIAQVPEDVRAAIFGNAGTMLSFLIGAQDAGFMAKEFGERFKEEDMLALGNFQAIIKLAIDNVTQSPFHCYTLPLPESRTANREKVIKTTRERYMKKVRGSS